jgi:hypothetical protein
MRTTSAGKTAEKEIRKMFCRWRAERKQPVQLRKRKRYFIWDRVCPDDYVYRGYFVKGQQIWPDWKAQRDGHVFEAHGNPGEGWLLSAAAVSKEVEDYSAKRYRELTALARVLLVAQGGYA